MNAVGGDRTPTPSPKLLNYFCHWILYPLLLSPAAVKAVARFVYGLGQLYDSFCLSAASERLYQLQTVASGPFQRLRAARPGAQPVPEVIC